MRAKTTRVTLRIDLANGSRFGPGKIALLSGIAEHGSIRKAGEAIGMSYRRAWLLCDEINRMFKEDSIVTRHGGKSGGGAALTHFGETLLSAAQRMEAASVAAIASDIAMLERNLAPELVSIDSAGRETKAAARSTSARTTEPD